MDRKPTYEELEQRVKKLAQIESEYKQLKFKLKDSEKRSRAWLENSPVCTKIVDLDFNLQYMSSAGIKKLKIDEITQHYKKPYPLDFYPEPFRSDLSKNFEKVKETGEIITLETAVRDIDGNELWYDATLVPVNDEEGQIDYIIIVSVETSERKKAEEALLKSSSHLRTLIQTIPDLIWLKDPDGIYLSCNAKFERFFGAKEADIIGKTDYDFVVNELADFFRDHDKKAMDSGGSCMNEEEIIYADDGHRESLETIKTPMHDSEGNLIGILGIARDITKRKRAEEALRESEARFRTLFSKSRDANLFLIDGVFVDCNEAFLDMIHATRDQVIGKPPAFLSPERQPDGQLSVEAAEERIREAMETGSARFEWVHLRMDGTEFWTEVVATAMNIDGRDGLFGVWRDITEHITKHKLKEATIQQSEEQYRLLIQNVADGIGIIQDMKFSFVNDAFARFLGYTAGEIVGKSPRQLASNTYRTYLEWVNRYFEQHPSDSNWQHFEFVLPKDGSEIWMEGSHSTVLWGSRPAILVVLNDISRRKLKELGMRKEQEELRLENIRLRSSMKERYKFHEIIGKSPSMQEIYELILKASATDANVLIYGESGTGKDLVAQTIHNLSPRQDKPFVPVNCGGIQETLFEREFFGHRKGAFTGADKDVPGFFDAAHQGTLFLDEISELSLSMQAKLLRAIEGSGYMPVGDQKVRHADVRIVAATNKSLQDQIKVGVFREDFYYRVNVIPITMPPLRDRREDIPFLVDHFMKHYGDSDKVPKISGKILDSLMRRQWAGNVRELQNVLERYFTLRHLDAEDEILNEKPDVGLWEAVEDLEKRIIIAALEQNRGHKSNTANMLKIPKRTLRRKMIKYKIE